VKLASDEGDAEMNRWVAASIAVIAVILFSIVGMIVGALVGNLMVPARLDWTGVSGPGLMLVGAFLGLIGGFILGLRTAMRVVDEAAADRRRQTPS
jgi:F0F1-type ATP synthase assembly protein I